MELILFNIKVKVYIIFIVSYKIYTLETEYELKIKYFFQQAQLISYFTQCLSFGLWRVQKKALHPTPYKHGRACVPKGPAILREPS